MSERNISAEQKIPEGAVTGVPFKAVPCTCWAWVKDGEPEWHWPDCAKLQSPPSSKTVTQLSSATLRDYIVRAHGMATGLTTQSDAEMRKRIGEMLERAIESDDVMRGFLGRGGPCADRDILSGGGLQDETPDDAKATYFRWGQALAQLTNGYKYPTEVCAIAREALGLSEKTEPEPYRCKAPSCAHYGDEAPQDCLCWSAVTREAALPGCMLPDGGDPCEAFEAHGRCEHSSGTTPGNSQQIGD